MNSKYIECVECDFVYCIVLHIYVAVITSHMNVFFNI